MLKGRGKINMQNRKKITLDITNTSQTDQNKLIINYIKKDCLELEINLPINLILSDMFLKKTVFVIKVNCTYSTAVYSINWSCLKTGLSFIFRGYVKAVRS